ncbi:MAG: glycosyltransferase [Ignavibacteria bacterium]|nr:glycosyltransferase [Ignavibacteria bacterium]
MKKASLIISVYNKIRNLELIFTALTIQSFKDFEVIIADDGSGIEMKNFISGWMKKGELDLKHVWQEDDGFRKNKILNECIRKSATDYLIFIDGDCIPHSDFVKAHYLNRDENTVLFGRRVYLGKTISDSLTVDKILDKSYQKLNLRLIKESVNRSIEGSNNAEEGIIIKNKIARKLLLKSNVGILGSNFSLQKKLLEAINGFDENFIGPGYGEDTDVERRLRLYKAKVSSIRNLAIQYHIYHPKTIEAHNNKVYYDEIKNDKEYFCRKGLTIS